MKDHVHKFNRLLFCEVCTLSKEQVFSGRPSGSSAQAARAKLEAATRLREEHRS